MKNIIRFSKHSILLLAILFVGSAYAQERTKTYSKTLTIKTQQVEETPYLILEEKMISGIQYILEIDLGNSTDISGLFIYGAHPSIAIESQLVDFKSAEGIDNLGLITTHGASNFCIRVRPTTDIGTLFFLSTDKGNKKAVSVNSLSITDIPKLRIEGSGKLCPGDQTSLHSNLDFDSYSWSLDNQLLPGKNSPSIEASEPGLYRLIGYTAKGCEAASISFIVREDPICSSITDFDYTTEEGKTQFVTVDDLEDTSIEYFWSFGDGQTSTEAHPVHKYKHNGRFEVCLKKSILTTTGRAIDRTCKTIMVMDTKYNSTSKNDQGRTKSGLDVYPNPNSGTFKLILEGVTPGEFIHMAVFNEVGREVWHRHATASGSGYYEKLTMPELATGNYFLQVTTSNDNYYQKLIIQ